MSRVEFTLRTMEPYEAWRWAERLFAGRDYYATVEVLEHLVATSEDGRDLAQVRELLARAYFHSAQLGKAVETARTALEHEPDNAYLVLLLSRALERHGRPEEAATVRRMAEVMGSGSQGSGEPAPRLRAVEVQD